MANSPARLPKFNINSRAASRIRDGHVWVYESDITAKQKAEPGGLVQVVDPRERSLGTALYSSSSQISLRLIAREPLTSEDGLIQLAGHRLKEAVAFPEPIPRG